MKYKIIGYNEGSDTHRCADEYGIVFNIDLLICGDIDTSEINNFEDRKKFCKSLIGKFININNLTTYALIANDVEVLEK